jgi:hypothetical protein
MVGGGEGMNFEKKLREIIRKGDTTREYRDLFKTIVKIHRESFTEENIPTSQQYLQELLDDAIADVREREIVMGKLQEAEYRLKDAQDAVAELEKKT